MGSPRLSVKIPRPHMLGMALAARELTTLTLLADGWTQPQIATRMDIELDTVKTYLRRVYDKLGAVNGCNAVHLAHIRGLLHPVGSKSGGLGREG